MKHFFRLECFFNKKFLPNKVFVTILIREVYMSDDEYKILNEKKLTKEEFENEKKKLEENKGVKVVKTGQNEYKTRIQE
jgi:nicotinamide riboside kinase